MISSDRSIDAPPQEDLHVIICFPWSMFSCVACPPYAKDSLFFDGGMRHYVRVVFERENKNFHLAFGDYDLIEARDHATAIYKAALKAKIECAKRLLNYYRANFENASELETKAQALIAEFEEQSKKGVSIDDRGTYVCQTYYETLDPMLYSRLMKNNV